MPRYKVDTQDGWAHHVGDDADERMTSAAKKRDIHLTSKSRPLEPEDFQKFDFIIGMDDDNIKEIKKAAAYWKDNLKKPLPRDWQDKVCQNYCVAMSTHSDASANLARLNRKPRLDSCEMLGCRCGS